MKCIDLIKDKSITKSELINSHCPSGFDLPDHDKACLYGEGYSSRNVMVAGKKIVGCGGVHCSTCWNRELKDYECEVIL